MAYSVHCGLEPPKFFEGYAAARAEYDRRSDNPTNKFIGWVGMLKDGQPYHYNGWESGDVYRLCRQQLNELEE